MTLPDSSTQKTAFDSDARHAATKKFVDQVCPPKGPPAGFNPLNESNTTLIKHGLPPRPKKETHPKLRAQWERMMSRKPTYVPVKLGVQNDFTNHPLTGVSRAQEGNGDVSNNTTNPNWSGAVITTRPPGETFHIVSGSWTVPNVYPPSSLWNGSSWTQNGTWYSSCWVGIDGFNMSEVLQAGTSQSVTVTNGQISSRQTVPWIEWYPTNPITVTSLTVAPGDLVTVTICGTVNDSVDPGHAWFVNSSSNTYTTLPLAYPPTGQILQGLTAEWIVEDPGVPSVPFANNGTTFMFDCSASSQTQEQDIGSAILLDILQGTSTLSTSAAETSSVVKMSEARPAT